MPDDNKIELSGSGLKVSYLRFLADGAAGLVIILLIIIGYYSNVPFDLHAHVEKMGREVKVFILLVALALAIPLGLGLNAIGWFLLGGLQRRGAAFWFNHRKCFLTRATTENYSFEMIQNAFDVRSETFYERANFYEDVLFVFHSFESPKTAHVKGINRLSRSMIMIIFVASLVAATKLRWWLLISLLVVMILVTLITLLEFYERVGVLQKAYIFALEEADLQGLGEGEQKIMKQLIKRGLPGRSGSESEKK